MATKWRALGRLSRARCSRLGASAVAMVGILLTPIFVAPAAAAGTRARILMLGDSLTWQVCDGSAQRFPDIAPAFLREHDGGCHGWSGATTFDLIYEIAGWRFVSNGLGQPYPSFTGQADQWSLREAIDRATVVVIGLGTNEAYRDWAVVNSPWPIRTAPGEVPNLVSPEDMSDNIDHIVSLVRRPIFWYDIGVHEAERAKPSYERVRKLNQEIWQATTRHANFHVLPWSAEVLAEPDLLRPRDVHLSDKGRERRWELAADAASGRRRGPALREPPPISPY